MLRTTVALTAPPVLQPTLGTVQVNLKLLAGDMHSKSDRHGMEILNNANNTNKLQDCYNGLPTLDQTLPTPSRS